LPSPKRPTKRDLLKRELADKFNVPLTDVLERPEAAALLGLKNRKSVSNRKELHPPFYKGDLGRNGIALYLRSDLVRWQSDHEYRRAIEREGRAGRPLSWPEKPVENPELQAKLAALNNKARRFWGEPSSN
jgi:hypothetical protein